MQQGATGENRQFPVFRSSPVFLFDLDGTLVDTVYHHVLAWQEAFRGVGIEVSGRCIHRRVGMSDGLIAKQVSREAGLSLNAEEVARLKCLHTEAYLRQRGQIRVLPGAREILAIFSRCSIPWTIVTSSNLERARDSLDLLGVGADTPVITKEDALFGKPDPDLFVVAANHLQVDIADCVIVGDSVWDLLAACRARAIGVGLLSGGYGEEELVRAGAYRVYKDPADMLSHLDEIGVHVDSDLSDVSF
jgi:beta-phosphoglucomutase-like phosphatase (HAD superfamily)